MKKRNSDKLQHAMESLENAIGYSRSPEFQELGIEFKNILISAVVQNFSLTFRVCCQMITHQLTDRFDAAEIENLTPKALLGLAAQEGIISNLNRWLEYLDCEHLSQSSSVAIRTFEKASAFLTDAEELLQTCRQRTNNERRKVA
ncbi:MAG: nucleotidyltransferase substrate binding protein [Planctomycetaceae bacterium]|nr:nucleotidyltransferase substrate binding protein [Planctomycetaceae bacterium]